LISALIDLNGGERSSIGHDLDRSSFVGRHDFRTDFDACDLVGGEPSSRSSTELCQSAAMISAPISALIELIGTMQSSIELCRSAAMISALIRCHGFRIPPNQRRSL
jgi:hypothetical protein